MTQELSPYGTPFGKNGDKTRNLFLSRNIYDLYILENRDIAPIDSYQRQILYGRIDKKGNPILIKDDFLSPINYPTQEEILLVTPVARAASDLFEFYAATKSKNIRARKSLLNDITPKFGYEDPMPRYDRYVKLLYKKFASLYRFSPKDLKHFAKRFLEFLENEKELFALSSFITSKYASPKMSGLVLEIAKERFDDDFKKSRYIKDPNFDFYYHAALKFGFKIDKNAPWRLFADINSPAMKQYYDKSKDFLGDFFETYYSVSYSSDVRLLEEYMINFYLSYIENNARCRSEDYIDYDSIKGSHDEAFWVSYYYDIKQIENS